MKERLAVSERSSLEESLEEIRREEISKRKIALGVEDKSAQVGFGLVEVVNGASVRTFRVENTRNLGGVRMIRNGTR